MDQEAAPRAGLRRVRGGPASPRRSDRPHDQPVTRPEAVDALVERVAALVLERMAAPVPDEWLSTEETALYLGLSVGHLRNLNRVVPSHKMGGRRRYRRSELATYQANGRA